jgi:hypothetical protein
MAEVALVLGWANTETGAATLPTRVAIRNAIFALFIVFILVARQPA